MHDIIIIINGSQGLSYAVHPSLIAHVSASTFLHHTHNYIPLHTTTFHLPAPTHSTNKQYQTCSPELLSDLPEPSLPVPPYVPLLFMGRAQTYLQRGYASVNTPPPHAPAEHRVPPPNVPPPSGGSSKSPPHPSTSRTQLTTDTLLYVGAAAAVAGLGYYFMGGNSSAVKGKAQEMEGKAKGMMADAEGKAKGLMHQADGKVSST